MLCTKYISKKADLEVKQYWIYPVLFMSVGLVGPVGRIYSIIEDVVFKVYFKKKQVWRPINLWQVSEVGELQDEEEAVDP